MSQTSTNATIPANLPGRGLLDTTPWYRQPWPWLLMIGPFVVVIAGIYTAYLAITTSDGLVSKDYYKKGLEVGHTLDASALAKHLGLVANIHLTSEQITIRLEQTVQGAMPLTDSVQVLLQHPTRAGVDQSATLTRDKLNANGSIYRGQIHLPSSGNWLIELSDQEKTWRLLGQVLLPAKGEFAIGADGLLGKTDQAAPRDKISNKSSSL